MWRSYEYKKNSLIYEVYIKYTHYAFGIRFHLEVWLQSLLQVWAHLENVIFNQSACQ